MSKNLFGQYLWEVNQLLRHPSGMTLNELDHDWQRSTLNIDGNSLIRKTWYEHRKRINDLLGIVISGRGKIYKIENPEVIHKNSLLRWRLNSFATGNALAQANDLQSRILCETVPSGERFLGELIMAMRENRVVELTYQNFWAPQPSTFPVKPYCLKMFRQRWYLLAGNIHFEQERVYALDRMADLKVTDRAFTLPRDFSAEEVFGKYFGVSLVSNKAQTVRLRVSANQANYLRSLPLHESQRRWSVRPTTRCSPIICTPPMSWCVNC